MLRLLVDTCVWLDVAKDYRHRQTLHAFQHMIETGSVALVLPQQTIDEFARSKERIIKESGKSLSREHHARPISDHDPDANIDPCVLLLSR